MKTTRLMLGFAGEMGAGKGAAAEIVMNAYPDTPSFRFSDALRELHSWITNFAKIHNASFPVSVRSASTKDLQDISTELRHLFGQDILERGIIERVQHVHSQSPIVIVDGIRRPSDISMLMKNQNFRLIYIELDEKVRWERHRARNEKPGDAALSFEQFYELGNSEAEKQVKLLKPMASLVVENDGSIVDLAHSILPHVSRWI